MKVIISCLALMFMTAVAVFADDTGPIDYFHAELEQGIRDAEAMRECAIGAVYSQYEKHLAVLSEFFQETGDDSGLSVIGAESERFREDRTLPAEVVSDSPLQENIISLFQRMLLKAEMDMWHGKIRSYDTCLRKIQSFKKDLSKEGKIENIASVNAELNSLVREREDLRTQVKAFILSTRSAQASADMPVSVDGQDLDPGASFAFDLASGIKMEFAWCPATTSKKWMQISGGNNYFLMGSPEEETDRRDDETLHEVILTNGFWIGKCEVTQDQFDLFVLETGYETLTEKNGNPLHVTKDKTFTHKEGWSWRDVFPGANKPVAGVNWYDANAFCKWMSDKTGRTIRLSTEAEWEYACRAGTSTKYYAGENEEDALGVAWYKDNSGYTTREVGQKIPNVWGLYDMHGNVHEWCADCCVWDGSRIVTGTYWDGVENPLEISGERRIIRGGSYFDSPGECCSADRGGCDPNYANSTFGLRVVIDP